MVILVSGRIRIDVSVGTFLLARQGDYLVWGPGIDHSWRAEEDSVAVTVRWPSFAS
jgi:quercetin dioxygenase-like cupin family protein